MPTTNVLVIEDEQSLLDILSYNLKKEEFEVHTASDGVTGLHKAESILPDLVILDLMLPGIDGLEICRKLRSNSRTQHIRLLILTAKTEELDEIIGFQMGADDYVGKPFKLKALIHRAKALLRRTSDAASADQVVVLRAFEIDYANHTAKVDDVELTLTPTEFRLLWTLIRRPGRPYSRTELLDMCRGEDANALERTIDVHIRSLRQKLGPHADEIETVRGIGYRFKN